MDKKYKIKIPEYMKGDKAFIKAFVNGYKERYLKKDQAVKIVFVKDEEDE